MDAVVRSQQRSVEFPDADGYPLRGTYWPGPDAPRGALLINAATGVAAHYYTRFSDAMAAACRRLLDHFPHAQRRFVQLDLEREGLPPMGLFGFFHARYRDSLWQRAADWLETG